MECQLVTEIRWWQHPSFADPDRLEAAELVAFNALEPALRSRGAIRAAARELAKSANFRLDIMEILDEPSGHLTFPTLQDALERIAQLERRLAALEVRLNIAHTHTQVAPMQ